MLAAAVSAAAVAAGAGRVVMEPGASVGAAPRWARGDRCVSGSVDALFMMKLAPAQAAELEETFWAVSTPGNPRYGAHLSRDEVARVAGAPDAALAKVVGWLADGGVSGAEVAATRDAVRAEVPCGVAERLFGTRFHHFQHKVHGHAQLVRAAAPYSLPADIAEHVELVGNVVALPAVDGVRVVAEERGAGVRDFPDGADCNGKCGKTFVTPAVLKEAYKLGDLPTGPQKGSMAIAEFQGVMYDPADLKKWSAACAPVNATVDVQVGKNSPLKCEVPGVGTELCAEALLDITYIKAVGGSIPLTDVYSAGFSLLKWMTQINGMDSPPLVNSVSYGNDEAQQTSVEFMNSCNTQFMKAGSRGVSVLFASGDQGVLGREGGGARYHPDFPVGSPYITAVGGTDFKEKSVIGEETAWPQGGGGFSDTFAIPDFQADVVAAYKKAAGKHSAGGLLPSNTKWNDTGRGYPDVAALGGQVNPYCIRAGNLFAGVAGTSASSPVVAGVFAKLNEVRLASGGKPLGFLNPWIYQQQGKGFNDVTSGRNCGKASCSDNAGFPAIKGWDAATGWGSPNFEVLKTLV